MLLLVCRRLLQALGVLLAVGFLAFLLMQHVGDPVANLVGQEASEAQREQLRRELGFDEPVVAQYLRFVANALRGDFGVSLRHGQPVSDLITDRLPATVELALVAAVTSFVVGVPLGVYAALRHGTALARAVMAVSLVGISMPTFLVGILLILVFSVQWAWLPSFGRGEVVSLGAWSTGLLTADGWRHLLLPSITLALFQIALFVRLVRGEMLDVLRADFIRFARARGLSDRAVHLRHALRNTWMPVITMAGLQLGSLISFSIITETVFQWPGLGLLFIQAVMHADVPVMAAYLCFVAVVFVTINMVVDLLYHLVDPRLRATQR